MTPHTEQFLIWSWEHLAWWNPQHRGYTEQLALAGRYSFEDAADIVIGHIPAGEEVAVLEADALRRGCPRSYPAR